MNVCLHLKRTRGIGTHRTTSGEKMHYPDTAGAAAALRAVTCSRTHPALASLQPVTHDGLAAVQAGIDSHRQGEQPWWASSRHLVDVWAASAMRMGWRADLSPTNDRAHAWDMRMYEPNGGRRFAVWATGLMLPMTDNTDALWVFEKGLELARASATELSLERDRERLVLAFVIPYVRAGHDQACDMAGLVDAWLARFPFLPHFSGATAAECALVRSDVPRNAAGWLFPGLGVIAELISP